MSVEDNSTNCLSRIGFQKKSKSQIIGDKCPKMVLFLLPWPLLQKGSKDLPNFLHECRGRKGPLCEQDWLSEKIPNPGL